MVSSGIQRLRLRWWANNMKKTTMLTGQLCMNCDCDYDKKDMVLAPLPTAKWQWRRRLYDEWRWRTLLRGLGFFISIFISFVFIASWYLSWFVRVYELALTKKKFNNRNFCLICCNFNSNQTKSTPIERESKRITIKISIFNLYKYKTKEGRRTGGWW